MNKTNNTRKVNGIFLLNKPKEISSNKALQIVKRLYKADKAGHTGSLDPLATGMLPICLGEATKFSQILLDSDKTYIADAQLGIATSTGDSEGEIIEKKALPCINEGSLKANLQKFIGELKQVPPMYSALKHKGQPLYQLARAGKEVERKARLISIKAIDLITFDKTSFRIKVTCSKGTYIRTLIEDIAKSMQTLAFVSYLHRENIRPFQEYRMHKLSDLEAIEPFLQRDEWLLPLDAGLQSIPQLILNEAQQQAIQFGKILPEFATFTAQDYRLYNQKNVFLGLGTVNQEGQLRVKRLLKLQP